jgi:DNA polymerase-4
MDLISSKNRWIAHVDMDSFYVSVERLKNPKLKNVLLVVGGKSPRSVVTSASYEARKFGVMSAMPMGEAYRLCPNIVVVEPDFDSYLNVSTEIFLGLKELSPIVEQASIDEAYLDFTGCERLYSSRKESGEAIRKYIKDHFSLSSSVGISTNKLVSKVASDFCKPNGLHIVDVGGEEKFFSNLPLKKIPGVGPKTSMILERAGINTCQDLTNKKPSWLKDNLGSFAVDLINSAKGIDDSEVSSEGERKSISEEETFSRDEKRPEVLNSILHRMCEQIGTNLRDENLEAKTVQLKIRFPDFRTLTRARSLSEPTNLGREIESVVKDLFVRNLSPCPALRLIGVSARNLVPTSPENPRARQLTLFENPLVRDKQQKIENLKDSLKKRFGKSII